MDQGEPTAQESATRDDVAVAIWGERPVDGPMEIDEPILTEIWGHPPTPDPRAEDQDGESVWPDLWGATAGGAGRADEEEARRRPQPRPRAERPGRFMLPESWVAAPQQRSPWRQRLHRP